MAYTLPSNHYRLSSQSYGGFTFDSVGRASSEGASTDDPAYPPLNGPPSAIFLPYGAAKTSGTNGRTIPPGGALSFGQMRTSSQKAAWVIARPTIGEAGQTPFASGASGDPYQLEQAKWDLKGVFRQFDVDNDGHLTINELKRAFRAIGLKKRGGAKYELDKGMFAKFDKNGDGKVTVEEFEANMPPAVRQKIVAQLNGGWTFDPVKWAESAARHESWDLERVFQKFDSDSDGFLTINEMQRAFRAIGLEGKGGAKFELDKASFASMDADGNGVIDLAEFKTNIPPELKKALEEKLNGGWEFDEGAWAASQARHSTWNMGKVFKLFDIDGDGKLTMREFQRAFRALGLRKRGGQKMTIDKAMFDSFDTNGDGFVDLQEFEANLHEKTRKKIEEVLENGWQFDHAAWAASAARHAKD